MKILCIGDSLVKGNVGVSWINMLCDRHRNWKIENAGVNGETLHRIVMRLLQKKIDHSYDFVIIGAGSNDVLIPSFLKRGLLYRQAGKHLLQKGYNPATQPVSFEHNLHLVVNFIQQHSSAKIIFLTMGCINEYMPHVLNDQRAVLNEVIRDVAWERNCRVADIGHEFEKFFITHTGKNYLLDNFFNTMWFDRYQSMTRQAADRLSMERGLHLTIDGIHLNSKGAQLYANEIERQLLRIS